MNKIKITKSEARRFLIHYHGLDNYSQFQGEHGVLEFVKRVGCIQYDPLNVVGRNGDLVLQARVKGYRATVLEKLLYTERSLVDGWDKMMAIHTKEDWPLLHPIRMEHTKAELGTMRNRGTLEALELTEEIKNIIKQNGPKQAREISIGTANKGRWGHRKLSSVALDYLFNCGELGIYGKRNTQKIYDLIENLMPLEFIENKDPFANEQEFYKWYFKRRIGSLGMIWGRNGGGWLGHFLSDKDLRDNIIKELLNEKNIIAVKVEGIEADFYIRAEDIVHLDNSREKRESSMVFLAPLDNILWDRAMVEELFNFKYSWEVYIPKDKRKFGYYVLPVLYGDSFVARFEPEMHRENKPLEIKNWWWEEGVIATDEIKLAVNKCLEEFCGYLGADWVTENSIKNIYQKEH